MLGRGKSDLLDGVQLYACAHELEAYILAKINTGSVLWEFGPYGKLDVCVEKRAHLIPELLRNDDIWRLCLKLMPGAKTKDSSVQHALVRCMQNVRGVNNRDYNDSLFVTWCIRSMHLQLSHLRMLCACPARFAHRAQRSTCGDPARLESLLRCMRIDAGREQLLAYTLVTTPPHRATLIAVVAIAPAMFLSVETDNKDAVE